MQRRFFGSFVPILDFIHAISCVFAAAVAGRPFAVGWPVYRQWIPWVWQGDVAPVITVLAGRLDGAPLEAFWERRQEAATGQRCYRRAS